MTTSPTTCVYCRQALRVETADDGTTVLVDETGGDVCGSWGTYTNEPHATTCAHLHKLTLGDGTFTGPYENTYLWCEDCGAEGHQDGPEPGDISWSSGCDTTDTSVSYLP